MTLVSKKRISVGIAIAAIFQLLSGCVTHAPDRVSDQSTQAILWLQNAGEYQALCFQAFNAGKDAVDRATESQVEQWAVVVDLDETMLDNSPYAAWLLLNNSSYAPDTWNAWCEAAEAPALPGAVDFANYVTSKGGTLFYVSNRDNATLRATMQNLRDLKFPEVTPARVFLKTDTSNKEARLQKVSDAGYQVVLLMGDNLNDFPELATWHKSNALRNQGLADNQSDFGQRFILLPNPSYGDWEAGMVEGYHKLSVGEKLRVRRDNLNAWSGN
jgi:5'-nucleotidase (lipoprotein e(P4) family)